MMKSPHCVIPTTCSNVHILGTDVKNQIWILHRMWKKQFFSWIENRNLKKNALYQKKTFLRNEVTCTRHMVIESSLWQFVEENCLLGTSSKTIYILTLKNWDSKKNSIFSKKISFFFQLTIMMMTNLSKLQENKDLQTSFYIM